MCFPQTGTLFCASAGRGAFPPSGGLWGAPSARARRIPPLSGGRDAPPSSFSPARRKRGAPRPVEEKKRGFGAGVFGPCFSFGLQLAEICISLVRGRHLRCSNDRAPRWCGAEVGYGQRYKPLLLAEDRSKCAKVGVFAFCGALSGEKWKTAPYKSGYASVFRFAEQNETYGQCN